MAGTIFSLALSQRFDANGRPLLNAPLYLYEANTSTPVDSYSNFGLTLENEWPLRTTSVGMIPAFWLPDGQYRARLTDEAGSTVFFDMPSVQTVGPSTGEGGGGGGDVDPNAIHQTGDMIWKPVAGVRSGWVRSNGRTIGSATSGATERANADTQPAYEFLWNNFSDTLCPVTGGRGASAAADFAANKPIGTLNMRGRGPLGLDDMGNAAAGIITEGTPTAAGTGGGAEKNTIARTDLPNINLSGSGATSQDTHRHHAVVNFAGGTNNPSLGSLTSIARENSKSSGVQNSYTLHGSALEPTMGLTSANTHAHTFTTSNISLNGGVTQTSLNIMSPYRLGTWYMRL